MIVNSKPKLDQCLSEISVAWREHPHLEVTIKSGKTRGLSQNALSWLWYGQISRELREYDVEQVHRMCKLRFGVPILCSEDTEFAEFYQRVIEPLPQEQQLEAMAYLAITRIMTRQQMAEYLTDMQNALAERGVILEAA